MNIKVLMVSGKEHHLTVPIPLQEITVKLNRHSFLYFGPIVLNTSQIVSIEEDLTDD